MSLKASSPTLSPNGKQRYVKIDPALPYTVEDHGFHEDKFQRATCTTEGTRHDLSGDSDAPGDPTLSLSPMESPMASPTLSPMAAPIIPIITPYLILETSSLVHASPIFFKSRLTNSFPKLLEADSHKYDSHKHDHGPTNAGPADAGAALQRRTSNAQERSSHQRRMNNAQERSVTHGASTAADHVTYVSHTIPSIGVLYFFIHSLLTSRSASGKPQHRNFAFELLLTTDKAAATANLSSCRTSTTLGRDGGDSRNTTLHFTTPPPNHTHGSPKYLAAVTALKGQHVHNNNPNAPNYTLVTTLRGTINLHPEKFECTTVTVATEIAVKEAGKSDGIREAVGELSKSAKNIMIPLSGSMDLVSARNSKDYSSKDSGKDNSSGDTYSSGVKQVRKLQRRLSTKTTASSLFTSMKAFAKAPSAAVNASVLGHMESDARVVLKHINRCVQALHELHKRYDAVDNKRADHFVEGLVKDSGKMDERANKMDKAVLLTRLEDELVTKSLTFDRENREEEVAARNRVVDEINGEADSALRDRAEVKEKRLQIRLALMGNDNSWRRVENTVLENASFYQKVHRGKQWGKSVAVVDASAAKVMAWFWMFCSNERMRDHMQANGTRNGTALLRTEITVPDSHSKMFAFMRKFPQPFENRMYVNHCVYRQEPNGTLLMAVQPADEMEATDYSAAFLARVAADENAKTAVRASTRGLWKFEPIGKSLCRLTVVMQGNMGGAIPDWLQNSHVMEALKVVQKVKKKFERNGKVVDQELRDQFTNQPNLSALDESQKALVERCREALRSSSRRTDWAKVKSPLPFITTFQHHITSEGRSWVGKATVVVDCSDREACAWFYDYCSRSRWQRSKDAGHLARVVERELTEFDCVLATIKKFPFPLANREFVVRQICCVDDSDEIEPYVIVCEDASEYEIDYGSYHRCVRGSSRVLAHFTPLLTSTRPFEQCKVTLLQFWDIGGQIPSFATNIEKKLLQLNANLLTELRDDFQRDVETDIADRRALSAIIETKKQQQYSAGELEQIESVLGPMNAFSDLHFAEIDSTDIHVKMFKSHFSDSEHKSTLRARTIIDASIPICAAWEMFRMSNENVKAHHDRGVTEMQHTKENEHSCVLYDVHNTHIPGIAPREFVYRQLWQLSSGVSDTLDVVYKSVEVDHFKRNAEHVRASGQMHFRYKQLKPMGQTPQTEVIFALEADVKGAVPQHLGNMLSREQLNILCDMRKKFDSSFAIDMERREDFAKLMKGEQLGLHGYSVGESILLETGAAYFDTCEKCSVKKVVNKHSRGHTVIDEVLFNKGDSLGWTRSLFTVKASKEQVLAYMWNFDSRCSFTELDVERTILEEKNSHNHTVYRCVRAHAHGQIMNEDIIQAVWRMDKDGSLLLVESPTEHASRDEGQATKAANQRASLLEKKKRISTFVLGGEKRTRVRMPTAMRIRATKEGSCRVTLVTQHVNSFDLGSRVRTITMDFVVKYSTSATLRMQHCFLEAIEAAKYDADDGKHLGLRLMFPFEIKKKRGRAGRSSNMVREMVERHRGLSKVSETYEFFVAFLEECVKGEMHRNRSVATKLNCLSIEEGRRIGSNLGQALRQRKTAEAGLYQWKMQNPAIVELFEEYPFTETMLLSISQEVLKTAPWGLVWRVFTGSALSMLDLFSDINVMVLYFSTSGQSSYGYSLLGMLLLSVFFQLICAFVQHGKKLDQFAMECLWILAGLKPGADAYRVASGHEKSEHHFMNPLMELAATKMIEMFCESIPGAVIQCLAYMELVGRGKRSSEALFSILISAATTGFTSASIAYDFDTDPDRRKRKPEFYGCIPDEGNLRLCIFIAMIFNSGSLLLIRCVSVALVSQVNILYLAAYTLVDMCMFLLYKILRSDLQVWIPNEGWLGMVGNVTMRCFMKGIVDYTGLIQFRHPFEMGGLWWAWNMFLALASSVGAVLVYLRGHEGEGLAEADVWRGVVILELIWIITFGVVLWLVKNEYRETFWSTMTGNEYAMHYFTIGTEEEVMAQVFTIHPSKWQPIVEEVEAWIRENWWRWEDEQPDFFDHHFKLLVPHDMVPEEVVEEHICTQRSFNTLRGTHSIGRSRRKLMGQLGISALSRQVSGSLRGGTGGSRRVGEDGRVIRTKRKGQRQSRLVFPVAS